MVEDETCWTSVSSGAQEGQQSLPPAAYNAAEYVHVKRPLALKHVLPQGMLCNLGEAFTGAQVPLHLLRLYGSSLCMHIGHWW